jgi:1-phosphofructokinase family hexose kinase
VIITLTLNPAIDQTLWVRRLQLGEVNRPLETQLDPAGKGINVSRMAHRLGWPTVAFGFLAGDIGRIVQAALDAERVQSHFIHVPGQTRINVTIVENDRGKVSTSLYGPGPAVETSHLTELDELLEFWLRAARVLVLAGSLLPGVPRDLYARYIERAKHHGVKTILDASGQALRLGVAARPDLIKPNVREAEELLGRPLDDPAAVARGALDLCSFGIGRVVISMGAQGAVCAEDGLLHRVQPPVIRLNSTVGSGDSLVAGLAVGMARGDTLLGGLRLGTAAGAATAMAPGTALGSAVEINQLLHDVRITALPDSGAPALTAVG